MIYTLVAKDKENKVIAYFDFDCVRSFDLNLSANVSSIPVESAETITDNISYEPNTYNIEAIVSSYGIFDSSKEIVYDGKGLRKVSNGVQEQADLKTHLEARKRLMQMFFSRQTISLIESDTKPLIYNSPEDAYKQQSAGYMLESESCIITSMKISYPDSSDDAFYVSMTIQKVIIAKAQVLELTQDEMIPQLTPLIQTPTDVGSTATDTKDDKDVGDSVKVPISPKDVENKATSTAKAVNPEAERKKQQLLYREALANSVADQNATSPHLWGIKNTSVGAPTPYIIKQGD